MTFKEDILFHDKIKKSFVPLSRKGGGDSYELIKRLNLAR